MAGSFDLFRRYQRSLLVFVAIMAMLAFFVLPPFLQMGSGTLAGDPLVARWSGGEVRESDLERAVAMRSILNRFLIEAAVQAGRDPSRLPLFPESEDAVVRTRLLVEEARRAGIVVSDAAINDFLANWTNDQLRADQFSTILGQLRLGTLGVTENDVFESLRHELTARNMLLLFQTGFSGDPPGWRWDAFRRLQQRAIVEVIPVPCETLIDRVAAPSEAALEALYAAHREQFPEPASPEPGFREPHRVAFEYLVADRAGLVQKLSAEVPAEEIAAYYEANKISRFRRTVPATGSTDVPAGPSDEGTGGQETPSDAAAAQEPSASTDVPAEPTTSPEPAAADENSAATEPPTADGADGDPGSQPAPSSANTETDAAPVEDSEPTPSDGAATSRGLRLRLVSMQSDADSPGETPASTADAGPPADDAVPATGEQPAAAAAAAPPAAEPAADSQAAAAGETPKEPAASEASPPSGAEFQPLEEVADEIREILASEKAEERVNAIFSAVASDLTGYGEDYALWQARGETGTTPPVPPDFSKIAETQGLTAGKSELVSPPDAAEVPGIGRSFEFVPDPGSRFGIRQRSWLEMMFGEGSLELRPQTSRDVVGNRYLSWKTQDQPEFVPTFAAARDNVERAWRIIEARDPARTQAEELAEQARGRSITLEQLATDRGDVTMTQVGPFSWYETSSGMPQLSQPPGVFLPGEDFMQAVFALAPGEVAVAFNEPKTVCYCIRLVSLTPPDSELRARFLEQRNDQMAIDQVAQRSYSQVFERWIEGLEDRYQLRWEREPRVAGR